MAAEDLEWERSKISNQDLNLMKKLGLMQKKDVLRFPSEESYPSPPIEYRHQLTPNSILHVAISITLCECFLGIPPNWALWKRIFYLRRNGSHNIAYNIGGVVICNHPVLASLPPLPEDGEVEEQAVVTDDNQGTSRPESEVAGSQKSAASSEREDSKATASTHSLPSAVSPRNKRKRDEVDDFGTSKAGAPPAEEIVPTEGRTTFNPYEDALVSSGDEDENPPIDATARTSTSHTLVVSETQPDGEETSPPQQDIEHPTPIASPRAPSPKRARVEPAKEPILPIGSSTTPSLDDPLMKEFIRLGTQFVGYRDHTKELEANLAEANKRADALALKLEQSEKAREKAESDAAAVKGRTQQDYDLENPEGDRLLDALSLLEIHGDEARQGLTDARIVLSRLFPFFFVKKEEPETFTALSNCFKSKEDLGPSLRQEGLKIGVEGTIALVANSQQDVDWAKVSDVKDMETKKWQSLIKAAKPHSKKILAFLGFKPTPAPSSSKPEVK
ncbi:hypothetical protein QYE76_009050 [Lolium multiflorum]|uniref:Transposase (putative) gypsy type domain-containing protein n=1 Tax=Lolium multiflorum TaxID=4521 RepID=A0AAD8TUJ2_LOLMU|nr:hypothetical protein QYE76_009050 [Lolium multiflorum]